jgi:sodium-dependent dicarboxylate transporter 2/3/5
MKATGAAEWVAQHFLSLLDVFGAGGGLEFNAAISVLTIAVSNTMTAGAAIAVLAPVVLKTATAAYQDPITAGFVAAISSAFGYLTPAAQPAFTIIYASGYLKGTDFFRIGIRMMVISVAILLALASLYWPLIAH